MSNEAEIEQAGTGGGSNAFLDPRRLARFGRTLRGDIASVRMPRLREALAQAPDAVHFELRFFRDAQGHERVAGFAAADVEVVCQRCLEKMHLPIRAEVRLEVVGTESGAIPATAEYEPLAVGEGPIALAELIEDELLLSLPPFPTHARTECTAPGESGLCHAAGEAPTTRPFAILGEHKGEILDN